MAENTPITVYTAECIGNAANCLYPNEVRITDPLVLGAQAHYIFKYRIAILNR